MSRQHQSCEDLTKLMKMEIRREEMIRDKLLDVHTYRPFVTPPPTPEEEPGEKFEGAEWLQVGSGRCFQNMQIQ